MKLPINKKDFYKNGPRYVNKYQDEMMYLSIDSKTIQDYHYKGTINREGITINWNHELFKNE